MSPIVYGTTDEPRAIEQREFFHFAGIQTIQKQQTSPQQQLDNSQEPGALGLQGKLKT